MRLSRKEIELLLEQETRTRKIADLENAELRKHVCELINENEGLRKCMSSNAKEICRLRNMMQQQTDAEGDYLLREEVKSVLMKHGKELENSWHGYAAMIADVLALRTHEPQEKESNEYIDGYADAMQDLEKFIEEKKNLRAEVGSDH